MSRTTKEQPTARTTVANGIVVGNPQDASFEDSNALVVQPGVARNAVQAKDWRPGAAPTGKKPNPMKKPTGTTITIFQVESELWVHNIASQRAYWLNYYLSFSANRKDFIEIAHTPQSAPDFKRLSSYCTKGVLDFYKLASEHLDELTEDSKCNLLCHKNNPYREKVLQKLITDNLLKEETWADLIKNEPDLRAFLVTTGPAGLTLFLKHHCTFKNVKELNDLMKNTKHLDFRLGKSDVTISVRDYIEFLNTLSKENRAIFLQSNHPLNKDAWEQVPNLSAFTASDYLRFLSQANGQDASDYDKEERKRLARLARKRASETADDAPLLREVDTTATSSTPAATHAELDPSEQPLLDYLKQCNITLSLQDFFKMRGERLSMKDFVRLHCEDFSFDNFETFIRPYLAKNDAANMNRILACFFNFFMLHPTILLQKHYGVHKKILLGHVDYVSGKSTLLAKLAKSASREVYDNILRLATIAAQRLEASNQAAVQNATDVVTFTKKDAKTGEEKAAVSYNLSSDYVITMLGSANTAGLPAQNYEGLIASAEKMLTEKNAEMAAEEYCLALSLKLDLTLLNTALDLVIQHKIDSLYPTMMRYVLAHLDNLYGDFNRIQADETGSITTKRLALFTEISGYLKRLEGIDKKNRPLHYAKFFDQLHQFTQTEISSIIYNETDRSLLLNQWLTLLPNLLEEEQFKALYFSMRLASTPDDRTYITQEFKSWVTARTTQVCSSEAVQEQRLLLELFTSTPTELTDTLNSISFFSEASHRKAFLTTLEVTIENLNYFKNQMTSLIQQQCPAIFNDNQPIFEETFGTLLVTILLQKLDVNDETSMLSLYEKYLRAGQELTSYSTRGNAVDEIAAVNAIVAKTKNPTVRFVLSGEEQKLRAVLIDKKGALPAPASGKEAVKFNRLLEEMAKKGNIGAVATLIGLGADANHLMHEQYNMPLLLVLINHLVETTEPKTIGALKLLLSKISEQTRTAIFNNVYAHALSTAFIILDSFPEKIKSQKCTDLFLALQSRNQFGEIDALVTERATLISPDLLTKTLKEAIAAEHEKGISSLLGTIQTYSVTTSCTAQTLNDAFVKQCDINDPHKMVRLFNTCSRLGILPDIITAIAMKATNTTVRFVLSGEEKKLRDFLLTGQGVIPAPCSHKEAEKYNRLLEEMARDGNMHAMRQLTDLGAHIDHKIISDQGIEYSIIQIAITTAQRKNMLSLPDFEYFISKTTENARDDLFDKITRELRYSSSTFVDAIYLTLLEKCSVKSQPNKCNALLIQFLNRGLFDSAKILIEAKPRCIDTSVLLVALHEAIDKGSENTQMHLLDLLNLASLRFSNDERATLHDTLSLLLCSPTANKKYANVLHALFGKLGDKRAQSVCLIESQKNNEMQRYEYAARVFLNAYEKKLHWGATSTLPNRLPTQSAKDWLIAVFNYGMHITPTSEWLASEKGKRTRETLQELGWISETRGMNYHYREMVSDIKLAQMAPITDHDFVATPTARRTPEMRNRFDWARPSQQHEPKKTDAQKKKEIKDLQRLFATLRVPVTTPGGTQEPAQKENYKKGDIIGG